MNHSIGEKRLCVNFSSSFLVTKQKEKNGRILCSTVFNPIQTMTFQFHADANNCACLKFVRDTNNMADIWWSKLLNWMHFDLLLNESDLFENEKVISNNLFGYLKCYAIMCEMINSIHWFWRYISWMWPCKLFQIERYGQLSNIFVDRNEKCASNLIIHLLSRKSIIMKKESTSLTISSLMWENYVMFRYFCCSSTSCSESY